MFSRTGLFEHKRVRWPFAQSIEMLTFADDAQRQRFTRQLHEAPPPCTESYKITGTGDATQFELNLMLAAYVKGT
jgi:hypothetical protein